MWKDVHTIYYWVKMGQGMSYACWDDYEKVRESQRIFKQQIGNLKILNYNTFNLCMKSSLPISLNWKYQLVFGIKYSHSKFFSAAFLIKSLGLYF